MTQLERQGYSWQTRVHIRNVISKMYSTAQKWKWLADNPDKWVDVGQRKIVRKRRALSVEEVQLLAERLEEPARTVFILAVTTGLRIGELLALEVDDVDLLRGIIKIQRSVSRGEVDATKTEGSMRQVSIPPMLMEVLTAHVNDAVAANNSIRHVELTGSPKRCRLIRARRESHGLRLISAMVSRSVLRTNTKGAVSPAGRDPQKCRGEITGTSGCAPSVTMVQSADLRQPDHRTQFRRLNGTLFRSVFGKRKMSA